MVAAGSRTASSFPPTIRWSVYAGLYAFVCATALAFLLSDVLVLLGDVLGLPGAYSMFIFASPTLAIGASVWWALVERRGAYSYVIGGAFGLVTALLTGLLWVLRFVSTWGLEMLRANGIQILVGFVLGMAVVAGGLSGLGLMYARRRLGDGQSDERD